MARSQFPRFGLEKSEDRKLAGETGHGRAKGEGSRATLVAPGLGGAPVWDSAHQPCRLCRRQHGLEGPRPTGLLTSRERIPRVCIG